MKILIYYSDGPNLFSIDIIEKPYIPFKGKIFNENYAVDDIVHFPDDQCIIDLIDRPVSDIDAIVFVRDA